MKLNKIIRTSRTSKIRRIRNDNFIDPFREWLIGLTSAAILFVGGGVYFFFDYQHSRAEMDIVPEVETTIIRYRQVDIAQYLTILDARAVQHEKLRSQVFSRPLPPPEVATTSEAVLADE